MRGYIRSISLAAAVVIIGSLGTGSDIARAHGPAPADARPELAYTCGNTFVVANARPTSITVSLRVRGTGEEGSVRVAAAPGDDPYTSESLIETRSVGTVELFLKGERVASAENFREPCASATSASAAPPRDCGEPDNGRVERAAVQLA